MSWLDPFTKERTHDLITRGSHNPTPGGTALFVGLRALDPLLQYHILTPNGLGTTILAALHLRARPAPAFTPTGLPLLDALALTPPRLALLAMSAGAALKQIHWRLFISQEEMPAPAALEISLFNTINNTINTLAFCSAALSAAAAAATESTLPPAAVAGSALYALGLALEWVSELQRARFKKDPRRAGKPCTRGLWALARHVNYGGYVLWRGGFAMAGAGVGVGVAFAAVFAWDFATRAIPVMDRYCSGRYGEDWKKFKEQTPYKLLPFIY